MFYIDITDGYTPWRTARVCGDGKWQSNASYFIGLCCGWPRLHSNQCVTVYQSPQAIRNPQTFKVCVGCAFQYIYLVVCVPSDCSVVASKLQFIMDDLLWIVTDSQMKAAVVFAKHLKDNMDKANEQSKQMAAQTLRVTFGLCGVHPVL